MNDTEKLPAQHGADAAPEPGSAIVLGSFDEHGRFRPTVHPGTTVVNTGDLIDLYAVNRMVVDLCRRRIDDLARVRISTLACWSETMLLGALAGDNPEYDGHWFDTAAGVWRNSSDGRRDR